MEEKIVFHCENVNLSYKTKQCLFNVNLDIYEKKVTAFIGPSGAGKTTLADLILGILTPNKGEIKVDDVGRENSICERVHKQSTVVSFGLNLFTNSS